MGGQGVERSPQISHYAQEVSAPEPLVSQGVNCNCPSSVGKKKKKTRGDHFKLRFRKNFQALLEEQVRGLWPRGWEEPTGKERARRGPGPGGCLLRGWTRSCAPFPLSQQNLSVAEGPNYLTACAGPPSRPQRPFCAVCGFPSPYTCVSCGARYCTVRCLGTHQETR